jgi:hypothetical protein
MKSLAGSLAGLFFVLALVTGYWALGTCRLHFKRNMFHLG